MAIDEKKDNPALPENKESEKLLGKEQKMDFSKWEKGSEKKEILSDEEKAIKEELRREIDLMELDENLKQEAEEKASKMGFLDEERKLKHLLEIAKAKGIIFAIKVAKDMKDPYILDVFHDLLIKEGLYKKFTK